MTTKCDKNATNRMVYLVEDVGDDEVDKITEAAVAWSWDTEIISTARVNDNGRLGLFIDFTGDPLSEAELTQLEKVLGKQLWQVQDKRTARAPWYRVWVNVPE